MIFESIGKWLDTKFPEKKTTIAKPVVSVIRAEKEPSFDSTYDKILYKLNKHPEAIVRFDIIEYSDHDLPLSNGTVELHRITFNHHYVIKRDDEGIVIYDLHNSLKHYDRTTPLFTRKYWVEHLARFEEPKFKGSTSLKLLDYGLDVKKVVEASAKNALKLALPFTLRKDITGNYVVKVLDHAIEHCCTSSSITNRTKIWLLDVIAMYLESKEPTTNEYLITDHTQVDRRLIPYTDWRRWVVITELENAKKPWAFRYVPKDTARGKIRYFSLDLNFDAIDLGSISFDPIQLILEGIKAQVIRNDADLVGKASKEWKHGMRFSNDDENRYAPSDVFINTKNINVIHSNKSLTLTGYITHQNSHAEFHDKNPYLNVNSDPMNYNRNYFYFDGPTGKLHYHHDSQRIGDTVPDGE